MTMLKRLLLAGAALAVAALPASAQTCVSPIAPEHLVKSGTLQLAINPTLPPQQSVNAKGELEGLNVDLGYEIGKRLCLKTEYIRMDFPAMIPALQAKRFDGIDTGMFWTEERSKLLFLVPYAMQAISIGVLPRSTLKLGSTSELSGKSVGVESNSYQERWIKKASDDLAAGGKPPITVRSFTTASEVMSALNAGQVDAAVLIDHMGVDLGKRNLVRVEIERQGGSPTTLAFRDKVVAEAAAKALNDMRKDGWYPALFERYGLTELPPAEVFAIRGPGPAS